MRRAASVWALALVGASGCRGTDPEQRPAESPRRSPRTPQPATALATVTCPDRLEGPEADALLLRFGGTHRAIVAQGERPDWDVSCPAATPTAMELVVAPSPDPPPGRKPCHGRVPVTVTVKTGDGALDRTFGGWLDGNGRIAAEDAPWVTLPTRPRQKLRVEHLGYRTVEPCCSEPPTAEHRKLLATARSSGLQRVTFPDLETNKMRSHELEIELTPHEPSNACGKTTASYRVLDRARQVAATGEGDLIFGASPCTAPDLGKVCGSIELHVSTSVQNQRAFVGYNGGQRLLKFGGLLQALVLGDLVHEVKIAFEVSGDGPVGIVMGTPP
ncbi:MAG TPA: hypothetical protein VM686_22540 [Polyangiaceae bacterium]|nr:hypothetical protein [Polyangiaceae bacterium]